MEAKEALGNKRADLVQLWSRGQVLEEMMRLLDQMSVSFNMPIDSPINYPSIKRASEIGARRT